MRIFNNLKIFKMVTIFLQIRFDFFDIIIIILKSIIYIKIKILSQFFIKSASRKLQNDHFENFSSIDLYLQTFTKRLVSV